MSGLQTEEKLIKLSHLHGEDTIPLSLSAATEKNNPFPIHTLVKALECDKEFFNVFCLYFRFSKGKNHHNITTDILYMSKKGLDERKCK